MNLTSLKMSFEYCPYCGAKNSTENKFCENCGQPLKADSPAQPVPGASPVPYQQPSPSGPVIQTPYQQSAPRVSTSGSMDAINPYYTQRKKRSDSTKIAIVLGIIFFIFFMPIILFFIFAFIPLFFI